MSPYGNLPLTNRQTSSAYEAFLADERIAFSSIEPPGLEPRWKRLTMRSTASPKLWMDADLAAYALASSYRMVTTAVEAIVTRCLDGRSGGELPVLKPRPPQTAHLLAGSLVVAGSNPAIVVRSSTLVG